MMTADDNLKQTLSPLLPYSSEKTVDVDTLLMLSIALAPILQHYQIFSLNPSLLITSFFAVIALVRLFSRKINMNVGFFFLAAYGFYASFVHGINIVNTLREMVQIVVFLAVLNGMFNIKRLRTFYRAIAIIATILIIIQYFCYYVLGFHLQLVIISLLNPKNSQWFGLIQTGRIAVTGAIISFYRPSAFFLEPSHFAIYCIPVVVTALFSETGDKNRERMVALFVSLGILLSTSGMGIGMLVMFWGAYLALYYGKKGKVTTIELKKLFNKRSMALIALFLFVLAILLFSLPFFQKAVLRIFISEHAAGRSAIEGRTVTGIRSLKMLHGMRILTGVGELYDISDWNMATFFFVTFKFGLIGMLLYYSFYVYSFFKLTREAQIMTGVFLVLSIFTVHMFGAYYKMYYTVLILYGYVQYKQEKAKMEALASEPSGPGTPALAVGPSHH